MDFIIRCKDTIFFLCKQFLRIYLLPESVKMRVFDSDIKQVCDEKNNGFIADFGNLFLQAAVDDDGYRTVVDEGNLHLGTEDALLRWLA